MKSEHYHVKSDKNIADFFLVMLMMMMLLFMVVCCAIGAQLKLQNKFSVGLQTLPIRGKKFAKNQASRFHSKMLEVKKYSDLLRNSPDYYVNPNIIRFVR